MVLTPTELETTVSKCQDRLSSIRKQPPSLRLISNGNDFAVILSSALYGIFAPAIDQSFLKSYLKVHSCE